jgi:hypothetical protein
VIGLGLTTGVTEADFSDDWAAIRKKGFVESDCALVGCAGVGALDSKRKNGLVPDLVAGGDELGSRGGGLEMFSLSGDEDAILSSVFEGAGGAGGAGGVSAISRSRASRSS